MGGFNMDMNRISIQGLVDELYKRLHPVSDKHLGIYVDIELRIMGHSIATVIPPDAVWIPGNSEDHLPTTLRIGGYEVHNIDPLWRPNMPTRYIVHHNHSFECGLDFTEKGVWIGKHNGMYFDTVANAMLFITSWNSPNPEFSISVEEPMEVNI